MSAVTSEAASAAASATKKAWLGLDTSELQVTQDFLDYQKEVQASFYSAFTPLNVTIILLILTVIYLRTRSTPDLPTDPSKPITFQTFTPRTLLKYNGHPSPINQKSSVYLAVQGKVYDVTAGRNFYGPGGPYENFAGRDATRGLACQSFDEEMLTKDLDGPLDPCEDLDAEQTENLKGWVERFDEKYLIVGKLVAFNQSRSEF